MDRIAESLKNKRFVFWEEIARDGAQAKTILTGKQRAEIARDHGSLFNNNGPDHLVFAAGFTSIGKEEVDAIKMQADQVDNCYLAVNCRSSKSEISQSLDAIKKAKYARIAYVLPASERLCQLMLHKTQKEVLKQGIEIAKYAVDKAGGIPVDVQLAASFDADPVFVAESAAALKNEGIAIAHLGDTRGRLYPKPLANYLKVMIKNSDEDQLYGLHFHNDLGFALMNNSEGIKQGIYLAATSWLGLAERNGLARTELLSFHLSYQAEQMIENIGIDGKNLFLSEPKLHMLSPITNKVSNYTGVPLKVTDPIVGTGVNSISTGTPFVDTASFQPFDTEKVLGIKKKVLVTQLASIRVIKEVSINMGYDLNETQIQKILSYVKSNAYKINRSIVPKNELKEIFKKALNDEV
ncbi:MAG: isopropylmalate/homocitrate/citramalate synthase [Bacteroidetes bacterium]|nr:MAG: isopropylmalate/homocitrate/citramalate synthase [Bacteroidota bacterium]